MEYPRTKYVEELLKGLHTDQVKIITGARRCGKSYLLNTLFKKALIERGVAEDRIIQVDFDGYRNRDLRNPSAFLDLVDAKASGPGAHYLLLDEIQLLGDFAEVLNDLIRMPNVDVYATGSNARLLSRDVVTEFRGRGWEIPMRPLSFSEFMEGYSGDRRDGYMEYITFGGLPAVATMEGDALKADYLRAVYDEVYIRDIVERNGIRNKSDFVELLDVLCSGIGCLTNPLKIANTFRSTKLSTIGRDTIESYISHLEDSFLFEKAIRYDIKGRRYIGADAKYYATDLGLRNARMNFRQFEETHVIENVIYNELRGRGYRVDVGIVSARRKDSDNRIRRVNYECDFVCNRGSWRCYVQSALSLPTQEKARQEQMSLERINDSFKKVIITKEGPKMYYNDDGILMMNVYDFLLDPHSLER